VCCWILQVQVQELELGRLGRAESRQQCHSHSRHWRRGKERRGRRGETARTRHTTTSKNTTTTTTTTTTALLHNKTTTTEGGSTGWMEAIQLSWAGDNLPFPPARAHRAPNHSGGGAGPTKHDDWSPSGASPQTGTPQTGSASPWGGRAPCRLQSRRGGQGRRGQTTGAPR
jgi:hypothetical protein